jgi:hypothetical protein
MPLSRSNRARTSRRLEDVGHMNRKQHMTIVRRCQFERDGLGG